MKIEEALDEFIRDKQPRTLILQGSWGRGKTHLWNARWDSYAAQQVGAGVPTRRYAYVSLFGLNSISEVNVAIGLASLDNAPPETPAAKPPWSQPIKRLFAALVRIANEIPAVPYFGVDTKQLTQVFAHGRAKEMLVCIDDIERRGRKLSIRDVLGLISNLNMQRKCSVVVILNDGSLGKGQKEWNLNREKVFNRHLTFAPTAVECISLIFPESDQRPITPYLKDALAELNLTNIRVVERVRGFVEDIFDVIGSAQLQPSTLRKIARSISLLTYCHMAKGEGAPTLKFAASHGAFSSYLKEKQDGVSKKHQEWARLLDEYQAFLDDPIDKALLGLVVQGYVDRDPLQEAVNALEAGAANEEINNAYAGAWNVWRNNFRDNADEVIAAFAATFPPAASSMSANNADSAFQILRSLGAGDLADRLIDEWMRHRVGARVSELDPDELNLFERLKDPEFIRRTTAARSAGGRALPTLSEAYRKLGVQQGHNTEDIEAIAAASIEDIQAFLLANEGNDLIRGVKTVIELFDNGEPYTQASASTREAVLRLADRSPYSADKVKRIFRIERELE